MDNQSIKRQVLIVDDEVVNREMLGFILGRDYNVIYAKNGEEALFQIQKNKDMLSIVLLDLLMPEIDGFQVLRELQNSQELSKLPVIVLTSEKSAEIQSLKLGAVDFITKPYDMPEVILARVRRSIELSEGTKIIQQTSRDELTGLLSKDFFYQYCERYDKYYPETPMDAIALSIINLSLINEINGRSFGSEVIKRIADEIKALLKNTIGLACRFSGTFYLYIAHTENCIETLIKFLAKINALFKNTRTRLVCGVNSEVNKELEITKRFDRAMLACDALHNNHTTNINYYDNELHKKEIFEECMLSDMEKAVDFKNFEVYYQPKYDVTGNRPKLVSCEALVRWNHPQFGTITPDIFVPLMESNGLISKIDHFVWEQSAAQISKWKKEYNVTIPVSVNLSRIDIYNLELENDLIKIINENNITEKDLYLEITETAYTENTEQMTGVINSLREKGFFIEMDNFGTGYSSVTTLANFPFDCLKIDTKYVNKIDKKNNKSIRIIELIVGLANYLKIPVIAEGVETQEQVNILKELNKNIIIQGFSYSKPVPANEFSLLIEKELKESENESKE